MVLYHGHSWHLNTWRCPPGCPHINNKADPLEGRPAVNVIILLFYFSNTSKWMYNIISQRETGDKNERGQGMNKDELGNPDSVRKLDGHVRKLDSRGRKVDN